ncbi:MAG: hypothetical protein ACC657_08965 [Thiohalomonadales bacterium]
MTDMIKSILHIIILINLLFLSGCGRSINDVEEMFNNELPVGTHKNVVVAFLDSQNISHSENYKSKLYYDKHKEFNASIPKEFPWFLKGGIYITFKFDENDILLKTTIEEVLTGL